MKTSIKFLALSILSFLCLSVTEELSPVYASSDPNFGAWQNESIFTPFTSLYNFKWSNHTFTNFEDQFTNWSEHLEHSYYQIMDSEEISRVKKAKKIDIEMEDQTFRGFNFEQIMNNVFVSYSKVGFVYQNRDFRSVNDSSWYDVFAMYGSKIPNQKHLYIFAINVHTEEPVIFYINGDTMYEGERFEFMVSENKELNTIFHEGPIYDINSYYSEQIKNYTSSLDDLYLGLPDEDGYTPRYHITKSIDPALYTFNHYDPFYQPWSFKIGDDSFNRMLKTYYEEKDNK